MENKIYIANLGKYNEGELVGGWISLPFTDDELEELFVKIKLGAFVDGEYVHGLEENGSYYEEYAIHDCDFSIDYKVGEYENIHTLNSNFEALDSMNEEEINLSLAVIECGYADDLEEAIQQVNDGKYSLVSNSFSNLFEQMVGLGLISTETIGYCFDKESLAHDWGSNYDDEELEDIGGIDTLIEEVEEMINSKENPEDMLKLIDYYSGYLDWEDLELTVTNQYEILDSVDVYALV